MPKTAKRPTRASKTKRKRTITRGQQGFIRFPGAINTLVGNLFKKPLYLVLVVMAFAGIGTYFVTASSASSTLYYVSTTGSDSNPGSEAAPWKTIQKAANTLSAGDTVQILQGTYTGSVTPQNSGASGAPITYKAYPGHEQKVIIDGAGFIIRGKSNITVSGIRTQGFFGSGFDIVGPGSNITISGNYTFDTSESGISVWGAGWQVAEPDSALTNIIIENNTVERANDGGYNEGITLSNGIDGFIVRGNEVKNSGDTTYGGEGIDVKYGVKNGKVYGNKVHDLNKIGIYVDAATRYAINIDVYGNEVYNTPATGITLGKEGNGTLDGIRIYNNVVYRHARDGIDLFPHFNDDRQNVRNITIANNTAYDNGYEPGHGGGGISVTYPEAQNVIVKNNIAFGNTDFQLRSDAGVVSHNLTTDPLFVNASGRDFRLNSTSPAINAGDNLSSLGIQTDILNVSRPQGSAYDIGAYEYQTPPQAASTKVNSLSANVNKRVATVNFTLGTTGSLPAEQIIVAVRSNTGANFDMSTNAAPNTTLTGTQSFSATSTFVKGTYTYWVAIKSNGTWSNLAPTNQTFTIR